MLSIRPGFTPEVVLDQIKHALATAQTIQGTPVGGLQEYTRYIAWVTQHSRTLGSSISPDEMERLLTSRRYWALLGVAMASEELMQLVALEMNDRIAVLQTAHETLRLDIARWRPSETTMAVIDTNVLMTHHDHLEGMGWHDILVERPNVRLVLWIPISVIDELDSLKRSTGDFNLYDKKVPRRTVARAALKTIGAILPTPDAAHTIVEGRSQNVEFRLLMDEPGHIRLSRPDAEIIDRALAISSFAQRMVLVSYDFGMVLAASHQGLEAIQIDKVPTGAR